MKDPWDEAAEAEAVPARGTIDPWDVAAYSEGASARAIKGIESGGRYNIRGPVTETGDRAWGKFQVMGRNVGPWSQAATGRSYSPEEFLNDPYAQEAVFAHRFGGYEQKYGPEGAARAWFAGEGGMNQPSRSDQLGTSVAEYSRRFLSGGGSREPAQVTRDPWDLAASEPSSEPESASTQEPVKPAAAPVGEPGTATFGQAFGRGVAQMKAGVGGALEAVSEATGIPSEYGTPLREAGTAEAKAYPAKQEFLKIQGVADAAQWAKETVAELVPQLGATVAGAGVGAAVGGPLGAAAGAAIPSFALNTGEIQGSLKERGGESASAPGFVLAGGAAAAALDSITPFRLGSKLVTRFGVDIAEDIAEKTLARTTAKAVGIEAAKSAGIEGVTESLQEVIGELAVSGGLDRTPEWDTLPARMVESFAAGALGGGLFGAAAGGLARRGGGEAETGRVVGEAPPEAVAVSDVPEPLGGPVGRWEAPTNALKFLGSGEIRSNVKEIGEGLQAVTETMPEMAAKGYATDIWRFADGTDAREPARQVGETVWQIAKKIGIEGPIDIVIRPSMNGASMAHVAGVDAEGNIVSPLEKLPDVVKGYVIEVALDKHINAETLYSSISHEVGHIVAGQFYYRGSSALLKAQFREAFHRYQQQQFVLGTTNYGGLLALRNNVVAQWFGLAPSKGNQRQGPGEIPGGARGLQLKDMSPEARAYWMGFDEWFAEQVARHFTTSPKILNTVDRMFSQIAQKLRAVYEAFKQKFGLQVTADAWIAQWLDSRLSELPMMGSANIQNLISSGEANARAMHSMGAPDYPQTPVDASSVPMRKLFARNDLATPEARATAAAADRFNGFYKWMLSIVQVAARNLHIAPVQRYVELWQRKQLERAQMMNMALETVKAWKGLGGAQATSVSRLIDDYMNYRFLTPQEIQNGVIRAPTDPEIAAMVAANGVNPKGVEVFRRIQGNFRFMLEQYGSLLRTEAEKIIDPAARHQRHLEITALITKMTNTAYAPALRFGDLVLLVKDSKGKVVSRYHFETEKQRKAAVATMTPQLLAGETIQLTAVPEQAKPFMGMPPGLLDMIAEQLNLTDQQRKEIDQLRYEYTPAHGFQHRFQQKARTAGYSDDFMRAFASYFFHGSNYFTNVKYIEPLRAEIALVKLTAEAMDDGTKRIQIYNYLQEHLNYMLDPRPDFAHLRGAMAHWALGFSPAAAVINLSQMAIGSYPFLAGKFGDVGAIAALGRAGTALSTFYKRGTLATLTAQRDLRALSEGVKQGVITEAMAPELAGLTEQDNLHKTVGSKVGQVLHKASEYSMFMFQTTEQVNRRVTFRAAWDLALRNPTARYVQDMVAKHSIQYDSLVAQGWAENEAAAFVTAKDATESTQFIYSQWANPRFMRGKLRSVFVFKNFLQNTLFMLWHYPEARVRSLLVFAMLGGLMGLPGAEDLKGLIKALGWRLFGKDWDVEDEARRLVKEVIGGRNTADLLLHGGSRYGFGIPAVMGLMGVPFPTMDMSKSLGLGRILPVDLNTMAGQAASKDPKGAALDTVTQALGYGFQVNANFYGAIVDTQMGWGDAQRWTKAMPRALAGLSRAWQATSGDDPAIRTRTGSAVIRFDTTDTTQMMEALGMAAGFNPLRLSQKWDQIMATREATVFWDLKRQGLLRQLWQARQSDDKENYMRVVSAIQSFNQGLPKEARGKAITSDAIKASFTARIRAQIAQESGVPRAESDIPIAQRMQELYPEADVNVRRTR